MSLRTYDCVNKLQKSLLNPKLTRPHVFDILLTLSENSIRKSLESINKVSRCVAAFFSLARESILFVATT